MLRIAHVLLAVMFVFSVVVQWNDPDPVPWSLVYGGAAVLSALAAFGRPSAGAGTGLLVLAGVWAMTLSPSLGAFVARDVSQMHFEMKAGDLIEEEARESGGLLLVCAGALLVVFDANARRRRLVPAAGGAR